MGLESEPWSKAQTDRKVQRKEQSFFPCLPQQTQIPDYAELIVKFLDALIDTYLPGIDEETSEESLLTPTSPYPPAVQSQLSITANLNLSNSMTSLATSQHSPGQCLFWYHLGGGSVGICWFRSLFGSLDVYVSNIGALWSQMNIKLLLSCYPVGSDPGFYPAQKLSPKSLHVKGRELRASEQQHLHVEHVPCRGSLAHRHWDGLFRVQRSSRSKAGLLE